MMSKPPICRDCKHARPHMVAAGIGCIADWTLATCSRSERDVVTGRHGSCRYARVSTGRCGPSGLLFEPKATDWSAWMVAAGMLAALLFAGALLGHIVTLTR